VAAKIKEFYLANRKEIIIACAVILFAFLLWFIFYLPSRQSVDHAAGTAIINSVDRTRRDLGTAQQQLDKVERGLDESTERIDQVQETVGGVQDRINSDQELVEKGRGTTSEIRAIIQGLPSTDGKESKSSN